MGFRGGHERKNGYRGGHPKNIREKGAQEKYFSKTLKWQNVFILKKLVID